jgi:hypothetical protein
MPTNNMVLETADRCTDSGKSINADIPSPFLYHGMTDKYAPSLDEFNPGWDLPCFDYARDQTQPEPDFDSYRPVDSIELTDLPVHRDRRDSLGFALQPVSESRHKLESSHVSDTSHDSSSHGCPLLVEESPSHNADFAGDDSNHILADALSRLEQTGTAVDPEWSWAQTSSATSGSLDEDRDFLQIFQASEDSLKSSNIEIPSPLSNRSRVGVIVNTVVPYTANRAATC